MSDVFAANDRPPTLLEVVEASEKILQDAVEYIQRRTKGVKVRLDTGKYRGRTAMIDMVTAGLSGGFYFYVKNIQRATSGRGVGEFITSDHVDTRRGYRLEELTIL